MSVWPESERLRGVIPVLAMPFESSGEVDAASLVREVEWLLGVGVDGLALALASEMPRLGESERSEVTRLVSGAIGGRVPLIVHAAAESASLAIALGQRAEADGATALMVTTPMLDSPTSHGQRCFFSELARSTTASLMLQDVPQARLDPGLLRPLADEFPGRFQLKVEVPPTPSAVSATIHASDGRLSVFGGAAGIYFYSELLRGSAGTMPGAVLPECFVDVWARFNSADLLGARKVFARFLPLLVTTSVPGKLLAFYREMLVVRGVFATNACRSPATGLDSVDRKELAELLDDLDLPAVS